MLFSHVSKEQACKYIVFICLCVNGVCHQWNVSFGTYAKLFLFHKIKKSLKCKSLMRLTAVYHLTEIILILFSISFVVLFFFPLLTIALQCFGISSRLYHIANSKSPHFLFYWRVHLLPDSWLHLIPIQIYMHQTIETNSLLTKVTKAQKKLSFALRILRSATEKKIKRKAWIREKFNPHFLIHSC